MKKVILLIFGCAVLLTACQSNSQPAKDAKGQRTVQLSPRDAAIFEAIERFSEEQLDAALAAGGNVNARKADGTTPLHLAAADGDTYIIEMLIDSGAKVNAQNEKGLTPLHIAAAAADSTAIVTLLKARADVNKKNIHGWTPLMEAVRLGLFENVKLLVDAKASLAERDNTGRNVLMFAAAAPKNSLEMVQFLVKKGAPSAMDSEGRTSLIWAIDGKNTDTALWLLERLDGDKKNRNNAELNLIGLLAMKSAINAGNQTVVKKLIEKKVPLNQDVSLAYKSTKTFHVDGVHKFFARNGVISDGKTPLFWAAERNDVEIIQILLDAGSNPYYRDNAGNTADKYASSLAAVTMLRKARSR